MLQTGGHPVSAIKVVCAWCNKVMSTPHDTHGVEIETRRVSHGICDACFAPFAGLPPEELQDHPLNDHPWPPPPDVGGEGGTA